MPRSEPAGRDFRPALITAGAAIIVGLLTLVGSCVAESDDDGVTVNVDNSAVVGSVEDDGDGDLVCESAAEGDLIDDPEWSPDKAISGRNEGWRGGDPVGGVGEPQYYGGAKYAFASGVGGWDQTNSEATWHLGQRVGLHEIYVHIPPNHSTATVMYHIYRNRELLMSVTVNQAIEKGWVQLASSINLGDEPGEITVRVEFRDSLPAGTIPGPEGQSIAIDAIRIGCI